MCHIITDEERREKRTMTITLYHNRNRLSPFAELDRVSSRLNQLLGNRFPDLSPEALGWVPSVNIEETNDELVITAELPGIAPRAVEIELEDGVLTLSGQKESEREEEGRRHHVSERRYGAFQRAFTLPRGVSEEGIDATFQDGVLRIRLPKVQEAKSRKIEIRTGTPEQG
jgi:HSP20 family protein